MAEESQWIVNTTVETFEADVIQRSMDVPVVVDFWAPWCGPCQQLAPILDKLTREYDGKFVLVKANIDEAQELAAAMGVQSIPLVVAFRDGQLVNRFMGLLPEDQLREWLGTILPSQVQELVAEGQAIEHDDPMGAETKYREAIALDGDDSIKVHLARVLLALDQMDECRQVINDLESRGFLEPEAEKIKATLDVKAAAEDAGDVSEARHAAEAAPDDLSLKLKLADALAGAAQNEEALEICLQLVQSGTTDSGGRAKETMLKIFELLGPDSELTSVYRRKLATALY